MKTIKIGSQEFNISCHASTYRDYADIFDRNIMKDLQTTQNFLKKELESLNKNKEQDILMHLFLTLNTKLQIIGTVPAIEYDKYFGDVSSLRELYGEN